MIVGMNDVLLPAREGHYAVGMFNAVTSDMVRGVVEAAEELRAPILLSTCEIFLKYWPMEELAHYFQFIARRASVPVCFHFDHGKSEAACLRALELGFTSIMYDTSALPFEENLRRVKEMAYKAHSVGVQIEAELSRVGDNEGSAEGADVLDVPENYYTDPEQARQFVAETGVDALAIAVGNAHGAYKFPPKLDFDRIDAIADAVPVPLVLHGGSGIGDDDFRTAIRKGIAKVNIFTDLSLAGGKAAAAAYADGRGLADMVLPAVEAVKQAAAEKIRLFGAAGKA